MDQNTKSMAVAHLENKIAELAYIVSAHREFPRQRMYRKSDVIRRAHELNGSLRAFYATGLIRPADDAYGNTIDAVDAALAVVGGKRNP